jgi:hypothetical protein
VNILYFEIGIVITVEPKDVEMKFEIGLETEILFLRGDPTFA